MENKRSNKREFITQLYRYRVSGGADAIPFIEHFQNDKSLRSALYCSFLEHRQNDSRINHFSQIEILKILKNISESFNDFDKRVLDKSEYNPKDYAIVFAKDIIEKFKKIGLPKLTKAILKVFINRMESMEVEANIIVARQLKTDFIKDYGISINEAKKKYRELKRYANSYFGDYLENMKDENVLKNNTFVDDGKNTNIAFATSQSWIGSIADELNTLGNELQNLSGLRQKLIFFNNNIKSLSYYPKEGKLSCFGDKPDTFSKGFVFFNYHEAEKEEIEIYFNERQKEIDRLIRGISNAPSYHDKLKIMHDRAGQKELDSNKINVELNSWVKFVWDGAGPVPTELSGNHFAIELKPNTSEEKLVYNNFVYGYVKNLINDPVQFEWIEKPSYSGFIFKKAKQKFMQQLPNSLSPEETIKFEVERLEREYLPVYDYQDHLYPYSIEDLKLWQKCLFTAFRNGSEYSKEKKILNVHETKAFIHVEEVFGYYTFLLKLRTKDSQDSITDPKPKTNPDPAVSIEDYAKNLTSTSNYLLIKDQGGCPFTIGGKKMFISSVGLATILSSDQITGVNKPSNSEVTVRVRDYHKALLEGYVEGKEYFKTKFEESRFHTETTIVPALHSQYHNFRNENGELTSWKYYVENYPTTLSRTIVKKWAYYNGIVHSLKEFIKLHPTLFKGFYNPIKTTKNSLEDTTPPPPSTFEEIFYDLNYVEPCLNILRELEDPAIDHGNNYIGKSKGIFPLWIKVLKTNKPKPLVKHFADKIYKELLNAKISGLKLSKDASEFRKTYKRLEQDNVESDIKALLSQFSQNGKLGK